MTGNSRVLPLLECVPLLWVPRSRVTPEFGTSTVAIGTFEVQHGMIPAVIVHRLSMLHAH